MITFHSGKPAPSTRISPPHPPRAVCCCCGRARQGSELGKLSQYWECQFDPASLSEGTNPCCSSSGRTNPALLHGLSSLGLLRFGFQHRLWSPDPTTPMKSCCGLGALSCPQGPWGHQGSPHEHLGKVTLIRAPNSLKDLPKVINPSLINPLRDFKLKGSHLFKS